jgi:DNA-binding NarL/FixJ family response regulator
MTENASLEQRLAIVRRRWRLTTRQVQVLARVVFGVHNSAIAAELGIVERTVRMHITGILNRSRCDSRAQLIASLR